MKPLLITGISIVNLALISYAIAIFTQNKKKRVTQTVLAFLATGIILDITATICMIISSGKAITLHGVIGYSALLGMLAETIVTFLFARRNGINTSVSKKFIRWSQIAFSYWVLAYITGLVLVLMKL
jgi:hypothetical protein